MSDVDSLYSNRIPADDTSQKRTEPSSCLVTSRQFISHTVCLLLQSLMVPHHTLSNSVLCHRWMAAYPGYTLQTKMLFLADQLWFTTCIREQDYSVSQKILSQGFLKFFPQRQIIFKQDFTWLLYIHIYAILQNFIQWSQNMTKLCHIKRNHLVNFHNSQYIWYIYQYIWYVWQ